MNVLDELEGVWFVYDGDCPVCSYAAAAWRIRRDYGELHLLDAREHPDHPLLREIRDRCIDLDEGMAIYHDGMFYHGKDALRFMARYADERGAFNRGFRRLFRSRRLAAVSYPVMRAGRNTLLRLLGKTKIDNLTDRGRPVFEPVFGTEWQKLPTVLKRRYNVRPYSADRVVVQGTMDLECRGLMRLMRPFYRLLRTAPCVNERGVPVTVEFESDPAYGGMVFSRLFRYANGKPYRFRSVMVPRGNGEVLENMAFGVCWRGLYSGDEHGVYIQHKGYALRVFGRLLPFPGTVLFGRCAGSELAVGDDRFTLNLGISHPVFGQVYSYTGEFAVVEAA